MNLWLKKALQHRVQVEQCSQDLDHPIGLVFLFFKRALGQS
jgi:hypothetical protein